MAACGQSEGPRAPGNSSHRCRTATRGCRRPSRPARHETSPRGEPRAAAAQRIRNCMPACDSHPHVIPAVVAHMEHFCRRRPAPLQGGLEDPRVRLLEAHVRGHDHVVEDGPHAEAVEDVAEPGVEVAHAAQAEASLPEPARGPTRSMLCTAAARSQHQPPAKRVGSNLLTAAVPSLRQGGPSTTQAPRSTGICHRSTARGPCRAYPSRPHAAVGQVSSRHLYQRHQLMAYGLRDRESTRPTQKSRASPRKRIVSAQGRW